MKIAVPCCSALVLALATHPLAAQLTRVVPANLAQRSGTRSASVFAQDSGRYQQLIEGQEFCRITATLREIAFRRDALPFSYNGRQLTSVTLRIGHSNRNAATMSDTFAANWAVPLQVVFKSSLQLPPALYTAAAVYPFNIVIKFTRPFVYIRPVGALLFEIEMPGSVQFAMYFADAAAHPTSGRVSAFGTGGKFSTGEQHYMMIPEELSIGHTDTVLLNGLRGNYPTLAILGASNRSYGQLNLPFDLTPLGAPGNHVYVSLDVLLPVPLQFFDHWYAYIPLSIPPDRQLAGKQLYFQLVSADPRANALGLVWSKALDLFIAPYYPVQAVFALDPNQAKGDYQYWRRPAGLVVRLGGYQFN